MAEGLKNERKTKKDYEYDDNNVVLNHFFVSDKKQDVIVISTMYSFDNKGLIDSKKSILVIFRAFMMYNFMMINY